VCDVAVSINGAVIPVVESMRDLGVLVASVSYRTHYWQLSRGGARIYKPLSNSAPAIIEALLLAE